MENTVFDIDEIKFWIIVWICEFAILTLIILKNYVKVTPLPKLTTIGLSMVIFGTYFFLVFTISIFALDEFTTICMLDRIDAESFGTGELMKCYTDTIDLKWKYFMISIIMTMFIVLGNILQVTSRRN